MSFLDFTMPASDPNNPNASITTPDQLARRQAMADALSKQGMDFSPVRSGWQGAARMAQALVGGLMSHDMQAQSAEGAKASNEALSNALLGLSGGGAGASASPSLAPASAPGMASAGGSAPVPPANIPMTGDKSAFVAGLMPKAIEASKATGIDPRIIVSQAAIESGWGAHAPGNNLFGIKGVGPSGSNNLATSEVVNGQPVQTRDNFRAYASPADSVNGYANFMLTNPRYGAMRSADGLDAQIAALGKSGYATDPAYAAKVAAIAKGLAAPDGLSAINQAAGQPGAASAVQTTTPAQLGAVGYAPNTNGQVSPAAAAAITGSAPPPSGPLSNFAQIPGSAPIAASGGFSGPIGVPPNASPADAAAAAGAADPVNPDAPAPGAVPAGPAQMAADPILAATAARAANPQPGDRIVPTSSLREGSADYPALEGSPEANAMQAQKANAGRQLQIQQLMGVLQNPHANQAQRQVATMLLQKYVGQDQVQTITDKDGSIWQKDASGKLTLVQDKGKIETIGKDPMGNPIYGTRAQAERQQATQGSTPAAQPGQAAIDPNLRGQDYLKQMPPDVQSHIQAVIEGREDYPSPQQLKMPYWKNIADGVQAVDPTFQIGNAGARKKLMVDATSGKMADTTNALNTAIGHLGELSDQAESLGNRSGLSIATQPYNYLANKAQQLSGNPAQTNFESTRGKVAEELVKAYRGAGGAESDIQRELGAITESQSPEQLRGAIKNAATLLQSKIEANQKQWDDGMGPMAAKRDFLSPKARSVIDGINQRADGKAVKSVIPEGHSEQKSPAAAPARKTVGNKTYEQRGSDWYEVN